VADGPLIRQKVARVFRRVCALKIRPPRNWLRFAKCVNWWFVAFLFRHSTCNEAFDQWPFADACRAIRGAGYTGIEIAPFTLAENPADLTEAQRREYRSIMQSEGLTFVGLHWLMVSPKGLHVTTPDAELRRRSWGHIDNLIDLCADLGPDGVMVFGSPHQRSTTGGLTRAEATRNYVEGLRGVSAHAADRGVTVLVEALPVAQSDVVQTLEEAVSIVNEIGSPAVRTMFDVHNAIDEKEAHARLVDRYFDYIRHVHVNELDGRHCGAARGSPPQTEIYDFKPVFEVLRRRNYAGWISLEAFDFSPGAERLVTESLRHLESEIGQIESK
jgi:sugar phosphate isomerase/epimerase